MRFTATALETPADALDTLVVVMNAGVGRVVHPDADAVAVRELVARLETQLELDVYGPVRAVAWEGQPRGFPLYDSPRSPGAIVCRVPPSDRSDLLIYAEATWTQKQDDWLDAHIRLFEFLGGVPSKVVPDNLKTLVHHGFCKFTGGSTKRRFLRGMLAQQEGVDTMGATRRT